MGQPSGSAEISHEVRCMLAKRVGMPVVDIQTWVAMPRNEESSVADPDQHNFWKSGSASEWKAWSRSALKSTGGGGYGSMEPRRAMDAHNEVMEAHNGAVRGLYTSGLGFPSLWWGAVSVKSRFWIRMEVKSRIRTVWKWKVGSSSASNWNKGYGSASRTQGSKLN